MKRVQSAIGPIAVVAALIVGLSAAPASAETPPTPDPTSSDVSTTSRSSASTPEGSPSPTSTPTPTPTESAPPNDATTTPTDEPSPEPTETATPTPTETATPSPTPTEAPGTQQSLMAAVAPISNLPLLSVQLPTGYAVSDLNASKDPIPDDPDVEPHAVVDLVDPADATHNLTGVTLESIKGRGNFTWTLEKKPYQIKFDTSTPVLGMQKAKTWILLANHAEASLMRNKIAYDFAAELGLPGSPDSRYVDLMVNGEYLGNYLLAEKVEVKTNRLELTDPTGVMLELDNNYGKSEDYNFTTTASKSLFVLKDAVGGVDVPLAAPVAQGYQDIQDHLAEFESYLYAADPDWSKISAMIDVDSFIKYYFVFELGANPEITQSSVYFWKNGPDDVLHAGPVWDFDSGFASWSDLTLGADPVQDYVKNAQFLRNRGNGWYIQLFRNEEFVSLVNQTFTDVVKPKLDGVLAKLDGYAAQIKDSAKANFVRWPNVLGQPSVFGRDRTVSSTWEGEVDYLRKWVVKRVAHLSRAYATGMPTLKYATHVQGVGWQWPLTSGQIAGTSGRGLQVEAMDMALLPNGLSGTIESRAHVQGIGWQNWQSGDTRIGTTGKGLQLEAVRFRLTGDLGTQYNVSYRVHVQALGWMDWVADSAVAGTTGQGLQIEAIEVRLLKKTQPTPPTDSADISYGAHVQGIGWMADVSNGAVAGTTGRGLRLEALRANIDSSYIGGLEYRAHVQGIGWQGWTSPPSIVGTVGRGLRMEAVELRLTGELAQHYTIRYRAHVQGIGWQSWVSDGATAGTTGRGLQMEAISIELVPKSS